MSEQTLTMGAHVHSSSGVLDYFLGFFLRAGAAVRVAREVQARRIVTATARRYSKRDLANFGWSDREIGRLQIK